VVLKKGMEADHEKKQTTKLLKPFANIGEKNKAITAEDREDKFVHAMNGSIFIKKLKYTLYTLTNYEAKEHYDY